MSQNKQTDYLAPEVEVIEFSVECGFATSNMENIGGEKDEIEL